MNKWPEIVALRDKGKTYECFPCTRDGATAAVEFLKDGGGGNLYRLDFHVDKHGDTMPRSTKVGVIDSG